MYINTIPAKTRPISLLVSFGSPNKCSRSPTVIFLVDARERLPMNVVGVMNVRIRNTLRKCIGQSLRFDYFITSGFQFKSRYPNPTKQILRNMTEQNLYPVSSSTNWITQIFVRLICSWIYIHANWGTTLFYFWFKLMNDEMARELSLSLMQLYWFNEIVSVWCAWTFFHHQFLWRTV